MFSLIVLLLICGYNTYPTAATKSAIASSCYSPSGTSCNWYRECLEKKHPCDSSGYPYALTFAERFCKLYGKHYSWFTRDGKRWVDGVRKCLQVSLVDLLRHQTRDCRELQKKAFASHTPCYLKPGPELPSVCDLPCGEYLKIFWTIKGAFVSHSSAGQTFKAMWHVTKGCGLLWALKTAACPVVSGDQALSRKTRDANTKLIAVTRLRVERLSAMGQSADHTEDSFADQVALAISDTLKWNKDSIDWSAYSESDVNSKPDLPTVILVLADKRSLGMVNTAVPHANLNSVVSDLAEAAKNRKLILQLNGEKVRIKSVELCYDIACRSSKTLDLPPKHL